MVVFQIPTVYGNQPKLRRLKTRQIRKPDFIMSNFQMTLPFKTPKKSSSKTKMSIFQMPFETGPLGIVKRFVLDKPIILPHPITALLGHKPHHIPIVGKTKSDEYSEHVD